MGAPEQIDPPSTHPYSPATRQRGGWSSISQQCQNPPPGVHCADEETQAGLVWRPRLADGAAPPPKCRRTRTRRAMALGERHEPEAHWWYLARSWLESKRQRKGGEENQKFPKSARLASLASPHCPRGKEQGGRRLSTPARRDREGGWEGWPNGSLPGPESLGPC